MSASFYSLSYTAFAEGGLKLGTGTELFNHLPGDDELEEVFYRLHTFVSKLSPMNVGIDLAKPDSP